MRAPTRSIYKYIDDTGNEWNFDAVDYLAEAGNLERIPDNTPRPMNILPPNWEPRHIKLVAIQSRPGMQKYRCEVVVNDNDYTKYLNKIVIVDDQEMRCIRFVGEQRRAY